MKETKLEIPADCEVDKIETQDGHIVVTFKEKERKLPRSWEQFCEIGSSKGTYSFDTHGKILSGERPSGKIHADIDKTLLPDRATAEAVLALCQLIQLRDCYNGDWVPYWKGYCTNCRKYTIEFNGGEIVTSRTESLSSSPLYFKTEELRDEFLLNFRPLIEKLRPLYGIKEGGEE